MPRAPSTVTWRAENTGRDLFLCQPRTPDLSGIIAGSLASGAHLIALLE